MYMQALAWGVSGVQMLLTQLAVEEIPVGTTL
jgi:hypothetical protein